MAALDATPLAPPEFTHRTYELIDGDKIQRKQVPLPTSAEVIAVKLDC